MTSDPGTAQPLQWLVLSLTFYFINNCSDRCAVVSHCGFSLHSLMANEVKCLFMCSFAIYAHPLLSNVSFMSVACFLTGLFLCSLLSFESASYTLETSSLSDMWLAYISSQSLASLFMLLTGSFEEQNFKNFGEVQFISFWAFFFCRP